MPAVLDLPHESDFRHSQASANLAARHLIGQVLDEACAITTAAYESGQPWRYLKTLKESRNGKLSGNSEKVCYMATQGISDSENSSEPASKLVITSTPQKLSDENLEQVDLKQIEGNIIGQGDEDFDSQNMTINLTTEMFINHLFDMSEVEKVLIGEDSDEILKDNANADIMLCNAMTKIMESFVENAVSISYENEKANKRISEKINSQDAVSVTRKDVGYPNDSTSKKTSNNLGQDNKIIEIPEDQLGDSQETNKKCSIGESDVAFYEKSYLTLNRDSEQASDEECAIDLESSKEMIMQEVDLSMENAVSHDVIAVCEPQESKKEKISELNATSTISDMRKSKQSLISRCRSQGSRIIACIRGWWRPGKRRGTRYILRKKNKDKEMLQGLLKGVGSFIEGYIKISESRANYGTNTLLYDTNRKATSLIEIDNREANSSTVSQSLNWKFNTISESLCNNTRWNEYTFETETEVTELEEQHTII